MTVIKTKNSKDIVPHEIDTIVYIMHDRLKIIKTKIEKIRITKDRPGYKIAYVGGPVSEYDGITVDYLLQVEEVGNMTSYNWFNSTCVFLTKDELMTSFR